MKKVNSFLTALYLIFGLSACAPENRRVPGASPPDQAPKDTCALQLKSIDACVDVVWQKGPTDKTANSMQMRFLGPISDKTPTQPVDSPSQPVVVPFMPDMGHGSHVKPKVEQVAPGVYDVTDIVFTMEGLWEIRIQILEGKKVVDEAILKIQI